MNEIRTLNADEVECRVSMVKKTLNGGVGCSILLYKDARCDMRIMDEVFGATNWARQHEIIGDRLYCIVSVYDTAKMQWVSKEDVGTESNTEKEKGQASDSFKRACTNWGIGRELYTAPFIWINLSDGEYYERNGKYGVSASFHVSEIGYNDRREIVNLVVADDDGEERFRFPKTRQAIDTNPAPNKKPSNQNSDKPKDAKLAAAKEKAKAVKKALVKLNGGDIDAANAMWKANYKKDETDIVKMNAALIDLEEKIKQVEAVDA